MGDAGRWITINGRHVKIGGKGGYASVASFKAKMRRVKRSTTDKGRSEKLPKERLSKEYLAQERPNKKADAFFKKYGTTDKLKRTVRMLKNVKGRSAADKTEAAIKKMKRDPWAATKGRLP